MVFFYYNIEHLTFYSLVKKVLCFLSKNWLYYCFVFFCQQFFFCYKVKYMAQCGRLFHFYGNGDLLPYLSGTVVSYAMLLSACLSWVLHELQGD